MNDPLLHIEGSAGAAGDMLLAALLDLGFPAERLKKALHALRVPLSFRLSRVKSNGMTAKRIVPELPVEREKTWRLADFLKEIEQSKLTGGVKEKALHAFRMLARVEGKIHGKKPDSLHFHELGGWDTLFDILGFFSALDFFHPSQVTAGPLNLGSGFTGTRHGKLPVPPPAVVELLSGQGFFVHASDIKTELVTPTAAVLLASVAKPAWGIPLMRLWGCGLGAGLKKLPIPNVTRIFLGEPLTHPEEQTILKLETNVDDMNPQFWDYVIDALYAEGALEVYLTPVIMKKSRPATLLTVLAPLEKEEALMSLLFRETTTLGVRREIIARRALHREIQNIKTPFGAIPVKIAYANGSTANISPEYEEMKRIAQAKKIPLKKIYAALLKEIP